MTRYTADSRDRVFEAVDMIALISDRTALRRAGVDSYFGLCPFHDERSGSFHVRPDEKHYHCFGCQASGDPFTFVMETQGLDFKAAMETLADRFGVTLETEDEDPQAAARRQRRERLHAVLDRTATYYSRYLWEAREAQPAREYLRGRGLEEETLREFRVGYAPSAWDRILVASRQAGYSDEELIAVGLAQRSRTRPGQIFDRFRERIMFPAVNARGRVLGFGARRMRENQGGAKYLNTSDGELYHKREVLFGIDLARQPAAQAGRMILVEGYTDVLALHQAGIRNAVGIMGTSLTEEQIAELDRVAHILELCLDSDAAGQEAMLRAARVAAGRKLELRVVVMPPGADPADVVAREGAEAMRGHIMKSVPFVTFKVDRILDGADAGSAEGRDRAGLELGRVLAFEPDGVLHDRLIQKVSNRLEFSEGRLAALLAAGAQAGPPDLSEPPSRGPASVGAGVGGRSATRSGNGNGASAGSDTGSGAPAAAPSPAVNSEVVFLALCLALPEAGAAMLARIDIDGLLSSGVMRRAAHHLAARTRAPLSDLPPDDDAFARAIADLVRLAGDTPNPGPDNLEHARLLLELARLDRGILRARRNGAGTHELAAEREKVLAARRDVAARLDETM